ncbi:PREDICTED: myosin-binding protein 7-like [Ipomoea nil]|uniref:myosin-binding protein 7-like n=1 Tax=Ipomoea nil TaxID=35883 RepID=UPI0009019B3F|nr:PREDICTED: myosin-binding protein 7-like [Ipomoea nil]
MDSENMSPSTSLEKCCDCECSFSPMNRQFSGERLRSVKRKYDECDDATLKVILPQTARIEVQDECSALREMVSNQQQTIQGLSIELDEERNAASSAANEAMSMILRLQREKAEVQMEFRQFKRFTEEKVAYDQQELASLENLLYTRDQVIQSLECQVRMYKHRIMSYGFTEAEVEAEARGGHLSWNDGAAEVSDDYPLIKCFDEKLVNYGLNNEGYEAVDVEEHVFGETPRSQHQCQDLECRIVQLDKSPEISHPDGEFNENNVLDKVAIDQSPRRPRHLRKISTNSSGTYIATNKDMDDEFVAQSPMFGGNSRKIGVSEAHGCGVSEAHGCSNLRKVNTSTEVEDDNDTGDRVYTIDSIHQGAGYNGVTNPKTPVKIGDYYTTTPRYSLNYTDMEDSDMEKLYARIQALEADKESMRQTIMSMRTEKAQLELLKEIAQHLYKDMSPARSAPVRKTSTNGRFSFFSLFKWIIPFAFWRKRTRRCKYAFGISGNNPGLLLLLDKGPRVGQWRCLTSTQV